MEHSLLTLTSKNFLFYWAVLPNSIELFVNILKMASNIGHGLITKGSEPLKEILRR